MKANLQQPGLDLAFQANLQSRFFLSLGFFQLAFILGGAGFAGQLYPFAFAFIAALGASPFRYYLIPAALGAAAGTALLGQAPLWPAAFILFILVIWKPHPLLTALLVAGAKTAFYLLEGTVTVRYLEVGAEAALVFFLVPVMRIALDSFALPLKKSSPDTFLAFLLLFLGLLLGLEGLTLGDLSLQQTAALTAVLCAAYLGGWPAGAAVGIAGGTAALVSQAVLHPALAGFWGISGMLAGMLSKYKKWGISGGLLLSNLVWLNIPQVSFQMEVWAALGCFWLIPASLLMKIKNYFLPQEQPAPVQETADNSKIPDILRLLSKAVLPRYNKNPTAAQNLAEEVQARACRYCSLRRACWKDYACSRDSLVNTVYYINNSHNLPSEETLHVGPHRCMRPAKVLSVLKDLGQQSYSQLQLENCQNFLAEQLEGMAEAADNLLADKKNGDCLMELGDIKNLLDQSLKRYGIQASAIKLETAASKFVIAKPSCKGGGECQTRVNLALKSALGPNFCVSSQACGQELKEPECFLTVRPEFFYHLRYGFSQSGREAVSGDSWQVFPLNGHQKAAILSDGMGVGEEARVFSRMGIELTRGFLQIGYSWDNVISAVNRALLFRASGENYTTLDLFLVDLYTGWAKLIKAGAAPSFYVSGKKVKVINSDNFPAGIMREIEVFSFPLQLLPGEKVVMLTDGAWEALGRERELVKELRTASIFENQELADHLLQKALSKKTRRPDDLTVMVLELQVVEKV